MNVAQNNSFVYLLILYGFVNTRKMRNLFKMI